MTIIVLDTGPLGLVTNPKSSGEARSAKAWLDARLAARDRIIIPEIADFELRRELLRANMTPGVKRLDALIEAVEYLPLTTLAMRKAAELWAEARKVGKPTASPDALDGDVILAAQTLVTFASNAIVASTNTRHLELFVAAKWWTEIQ